MISRALILTTVAFCMTARAEINEVILEQIRAMPQGGGYATTSSAHAALKSSAQIEGGSVRIRPTNAMPSYCSGATYLVFLKTLGALQKSGQLTLSGETWETLLPTGQPDGHGVWGRWNANGPGTARLFHELGLGENFTDWSKARAGDFMKIFWTKEVGKAERGHSVVYLGTETVDGVEHVRFWSSNKPGGYGEKSVAKSKVARAIFSRLNQPQQLNATLPRLPERDAYLASLLTKASSFSEVSAKCGMSQ